MRICSFLWVYYGYPTSTYEGVNVEEMRYKCGDMLAQRDAGQINPDIVAGVTAKLTGWGAWDGKYIVEQAAHSVGSSGYTTQVKLRKTLEGY